MKIFISSTYLDLIDERNKAISTVDRIGQAIAMEKWFAEAKAPKKAAINKLTESDAVVLILGFKYGSVDEEEGISITEIEYNTAKKCRIPVFVFLKIPSEGSKWRSGEEDKELDNKLNAFKSRLDLEDNLRTTFNTPQELATEIIGSIREYEIDNGMIEASSAALYKEFTTEWFKEYLDIATLNLGERYNPELNFELDIAKIFDGIARDEKFEEQFKNRLNDLIIKLKDNKLRINDKVVEENKIKLHENVDSLINLYNEIPFVNVDPIDYTTINKITDNIESIISNFEDRINELIEQEDTKKDDEQIYNTSLYYLKETYPSLWSFKDFINGTTAKLSNNPFLLLDGDAGIGKSHLLADIANKRSGESKNSILLLGQHLTSDEDPWTQIFKQFKLNCSVDEFLGALELKAQNQGSRILIFIDAINEGNGRSLWPNHLLGFIRSFRNYKWLGLVLSIRSSYLKLIAPEENRINEFVVRYTHYGFRNVEYKASKLFFQNYKIELPSIPLLNPEFQNPLFLKIFCEGLNKAGLTRVPDGMQGITQIIDFFIKAINKNLSKEFGYPESLNLVDKIIKKLIEYKIESDLTYIPYETSFSLIFEIQSKYGIQDSNFIESLISEGIISKNLYWDDDESEEGIYIAYERFEDHMAVSYLLNIDESSLKKEFEAGGNLYKFTKDFRSLNYYDGIIEALSIQLPEKFGKELYELIPEFDDLETWKKNQIFQNIAVAFVSSLLWRKQSTITDKVYDYINGIVLRFNQSSTLFWEVVISVAHLPGHLLNADKTHEILSRNSISDRDSWWTQQIHDDCSYDTPVKRIIEWAWSSEDKTYISDESIRLSSIMMAWFLTSTNRRLRDSATKALICILKDRIKVLKDVLIKFEDVNDPYVYERLFAVAYGCALRTNDYQSLKELSEYIYSTIFDKDLVYPHVLLRDYARNVIEYALYLGIDFYGDLEKIRPPYNSSFPLIPPDSEIEKYELSYNHDDFKDYNISQNLILRSMQVEHTREGKVAFYGDFGRYIFQSNFSYWKDLNPIDLRNIAIKRVFDLGYDVNKHGEFDKTIHERHHYNRHYVATERIGKKYQWIAMHELLAQVADNCKMNDTYQLNEGEQNCFQGPWAPLVRDIDPSVLKKDKQKPNLTIFDDYYDNWDVDNKSWLELDDYPHPQDFINISLEDENWLLLEGNLNWEEPELLGNEKYHYPQKYLWYQIRSYLVKKDEFEFIIQWLNDKNFMGRWMPESYERGEIFNREFYWSPSYNYFLKNYHDNTYLRKIRENHLDEEGIGEVIATTESNAWGSKNDMSNAEPNVLKLCNYLFSNMNLNYGKNEGVLYSKEGEVICYDLSEFYSVGYNLVIQNDTLLNFLDESDYRIFWTILGEKNIIGDGGQSEYGVWPSISGVYYFDEERKLIGTLNKF